MGADRYTADDAELALARLRERLDTLQSATPLLYRTQNGGDYENFTLRPELAPGETGLSMHHRNPRHHYAARTAIALKAVQGRLDAGLTVRAICSTPLAHT